MKINSTLPQKTRLAPTPSGFLHVGNLFSFALTAALARQTTAGILLRIDDMDRERLHPPFVQDIFDTLHRMEIPWSEGPENAHDFEQNYSQLQRLPLYQKALDRLCDLGLVYACTCSRAQVLRESRDGAYPGTCRHRNIPLDTPDAAWRLNTSNAGMIRVTTWRRTVTEAQLPAQMQDFVVRKKDGFPAYQLASLVDDAHFGVDLIVRGQDLWPSTLAQLHLATLLHMQNFTHSAFYHHRLLLGTDGEKLSKSAGDTSIRYLWQQHRQASDIYALLGRELNLSFPLKHWKDLEPHLADFANLDPEL